MLTDTASHVYIPPQNKNTHRIINTEKGKDKVIFSSYNDISGDKMNCRHILLETCSGASVFSNRDLFYDIKESDNQ